MCALGNMVGALTLGLAGGNEHSKWATGFAQPGGSLPVDSVFGVEYRVGGGGVDRAGYAADFD